MSNCLVVDFPKRAPTVATATGTTQYAVMIGCSRGDYIARVFNDWGRAQNHADLLFNRFDLAARLLSEHYRSSLPMEVGHANESIYVVVMCDGLPERTLLRYDAAEIKLLRDMQNNNTHTNYLVN